MSIRKLFLGALTLASVLVVGAKLVSAVDSTVVVSGNTSAGENQPGWMFNRDVTTSTPYVFNTDAASIGAGSLYVLPIGANASDKFVAENFLKSPVSELNSIAYDFKIAGNGDAADANQFYLNVYATTENDNKFYDCRFDYVPTTGSTAGFTTATFAATDTPVNVQRSGTARLATCPATLAGMPVGSYVRAFSLSVGDTSASDVGLAGYLDKVVVDQDNGVTTYDLDPVPAPTPTPTPTATPTPTPTPTPMLTPTNKDQCKKDGWKLFNAPKFKNQGDCVSYTNHN